MSILKKKAVLTADAQSFVAAYPMQMARLVNYRFEREWIDHAADTLRLYRSTMTASGHTQEIKIIVADTLDNTRVFLMFSPYSAYIRLKEKQEKHPLKKQNFIQRITSEKRAYLTHVFDEGAQDICFSAYNGKY